MPGGQREPLAVALAASLPVALPRRAPLAVVGDTAAVGALAVTVDLPDPRWVRRWR